MSEHVMKEIEQLRDKMRERICSIVNDSGPMRVTEVVSIIATEFYGGTHGTLHPEADIGELFNSVLRVCIEEEGVVELEYIRTDTPYKISSLLFPMGTVFHDWRGEKSGTIRNDLKKED